MEQNIKIVSCRVGKNGRVGLEGDLRAGFICLAYYFKVAYNISLFIALNILFAAGVYFYLEPFGQRVYHRSADSVKTARYLVSASAEFSARVQYRKYNAYGRYPLLRMYSYRYSSSVVGNPYNTVVKYLHKYFVAVAGERLVYRVIHNFIDKVVKTSFSR